jgi:phage terminase large subunit
MAIQKSQERVDSLRIQETEPWAILRSGLVSQIGAEKEAIVWPDSRYWQNPASFFVENLGMRPWDKQIEIAESLRDHDRVTAATSHKTGKSAIAASLALWFYSSVDDARIIMTSSTLRQVQEILWREMTIRWRHARRGQCVHCANLEKWSRKETPCPHGNPLVGEFSSVAMTGIVAQDMREIKGFTAQDAEKMAGISSPALLYICDEASGVADQIFAAIEGNRAGGAKILLLGNPTRNDGEFYLSHHEKSYHRITVSAYQTPNAVAGWKVIPGLATREWIEEKLEDWGEDSAEFMVRALGKFAVGEEGCTISLQLISDSQDRWQDTPAEGRLYIGVDVAGPGQQGDETVISTRRGFRHLTMVAHRGLTEEGILTNILGTINDSYSPGEPIPVVVVDVEGDIGNKVHNVINAHLEACPGEFVYVPLRASHNAVKMPRVYEKIRDDMWANMVRWLRAGGAVLSDSKLSQELHYPKWEQSPRSPKMKLVPKDVIRKRLKRSPDRAESLELACWEPGDLEERVLEVQDNMQQKVNPDYDPEVESPKELDVYAGASQWG